MMLSLPLAAGIDQGDIAKVLIFGVAIVIWLLNAFATWVAKQKEEQNRRRVREQLDKTPRQPPVDQRAPMPPRPMQQRPTAARPGPPKLPPLPSPVVRDGRGKRKQKQPSMPPRPPVQAEQFPAPVITAIAAPTPQVSAPRPSSADANAIRTWMRPATMRQQFILTEVLQPPIALRESHLNS